MNKEEFIGRYAEIKHIDSYVFVYTTERGGLIQPSNGKYKKHGELLRYRVDKVLLYGDSIEMYWNGKFQGSVRVIDVRGME